MIMTRFVVVLFVVVAVTTGCSTDEDVNQSPPANRLGNQSVVTGVVEFRSGDWMPGPGGPTGTSEPVERTLRFYEPTGFDQVTPHDELGGGFFSAVETDVVGTAVSDASGRFVLALSPGTYSLFIEEAGTLYSPRSDSRIFWPVVVEESRPTELEVIIDYAAAY